MKKKQQLPKPESFINYDINGRKIIRTYAYGRKLGKNEQIPEADKELSKDFIELEKQLKGYFPAYPFRCGLQKADELSLHLPAAITDNFLKTTGGFQKPLRKDELLVIDQAVGSRDISDIKAFLVQRCNCQNPEVFNWGEILNHLRFWLKNQEKDENTKSPAGAGEENKPSAMSVDDISRKFNIPKESLRKKLDRRRGKDLTCFIEVEKTDTISPKYLYYINRIQDIIDARKRPSNVRRKK